MINHFIHPDILMSMRKGNISPEASFIVGYLALFVGVEDVVTYEKNEVYI